VRGRSAGFKEAYATFDPTRRAQTKPITAAELMDMEFEPTRWVVPDVLPEGLSRDVRGRRRRRRGPRNEARR
jgi:hypothetical protein